MSGTFPWVKKHPLLGRAAVLGMAIISPVSVPTMLVVDNRWEILDAVKETWRAAVSPWDFD